MNGKNYKDNARKKGSQSDICPAPTAILPKRCQLILEKASKAKNLCDTKGNSGLSRERSLVYPLYATNRSKVDKPD